jgi:cytochrome c553
MFHIKNIIAVSFALAALLSSTATFAEGNAPAVAAAPTTDEAAAPAIKKSIKKTIKKKSSKATAAAAPAATAPAESAETKSSAVKLAKGQAQDPVTGEIRDGDGSQDDIKTRGGLGDPVAGKTKSELCQGCHGPEGISLEPLIPKLAGQYGAYIAKQVRNYQAGTRSHQIMSAMAETINDNELADIGAYFASRVKMKGNGASNNELGKKLFLYGDMTRMMVACVNCHGANGKGKTPSNSVFPVIGGQHRDYLFGQLTNFRKGDRSNSPGGVMNIITQKLTDEELNALAEYVSEL